MLQIRQNQSQKSLQDLELMNLCKNGAVIKNDLHAKYSFMELKEYKTIILH